jgi:hypothetical protein
MKTCRSCKGTGVGADFAGIPHRCTLCGGLGFEASDGGMSKIARGLPDDDAQAALKFSQVAAPGVPTLADGGVTHIPPDLADDNEVPRWLDEYERDEWDGILYSTDPGWRHLRALASARCALASTRAALAKANEQHAEDTRMLSEIAELCSGHEDRIEDLEAKLNAANARAAAAARLLEAFSPRRIGFGQSLSHDSLGSAQVEARAFLARLDAPKGKEGAE